MYFRFILVFILSLYWTPLSAHKASDSYLTLTLSETTGEGRWDIALRDLDYAIGLDANNDNAITWGELRNQREIITNYAFSNLRISDGLKNLCQLTAKDFLVDQHTDGTYSVLLFTLKCNQSLSRLGIDYSLFFDLDPQHRGLLRIAFNQITHTAVLSPANKSQEIVLAKPKKWATFAQYLKEGIWHIWLGYDHILFLMSLLLPSVFYRSAKFWQPVQKFRPVLLEVIKIVTAFTVAHSITLSLAALDVISLPSQWVESTIAASVILAALNNIFPLINKKLWLVAFGFGLVHGLGFANVLKDLGLPQSALVLALLAFNVGVEAGQLAIVSGFLPLAFWGRNRWWYRRLCVQLGSVIIALLACIWLLERSLNLKLIS